MANQIKRVKNALIRSFQLDHIAFYFEMLGTFFTIAGSLLLAITAKDPNMLVIFPIYEIGSMALMYAYYRRQMVWSIFLTGYFIIINIVGFTIALG